MACPDCFSNGTCHLLCQAYKNSAAESIRGFLNFSNFLAKKDGIKDGISSFMDDFKLNKPALSIFGRKSTYVRSRR